MRSTGGMAGPEPVGSLVPVPAGFWSPFCPRYTASSVCEITPELLTRLGIRAVILDLDNTLVPWHGEALDEAVESWVRQLREAGFRLCIASNTHRPGRLRRLAERLQVLHATRVAKPRRGGFERAMAAMEARPEETAVIGDQLFTDIWGGNRCRLLTVLVNPLTPKEFIGTRLVSRSLERWLLARFTARGWLRPLSGIQVFRCSGVQGEPEATLDAEHLNT
jgi:HAD superfamily phosphatase (TIGR01668 family)